MKLNQLTTRRNLFLPQASTAALWLLASCFAAPALSQDNAVNRSKPDDALSSDSHTYPYVVRVLSYNIHHAEGTDGRLDLERIAKVIQSAETDITALQEVDSKVKRSREVDQPKELGQLTGMHPVFGGNIDLEGGKYGNALLSRGDVVRFTNHLLPNLDQGEQRGVLDALVTHRGQRLRVLATHFDHRREPRERIASIKMINALVTEQADMPTLFIGDLNAEFESEVLDLARQVWKVANTERLPTFPVTKPQRQIDFILCYPPQRWRIKDVKVLDEPIASDHRPIMAELEFR